jgi:hypothetical protein
MPAINKTVNITSRDRFTNSHKDFPKATQGIINALFRKIHQDVIELTCCHR